MSLEERRLGVGGSEVAAALGKNPYYPARRLYYEKIGKLKPKDLSDNFWVESGTAQEEFIRSWFTKRTGYKVEHSGRFICHQKYHYMYGNVDGIGTDENGDKFVLEIKTTNAFNAKEWKDDKIPLHYEFQLLYYLILTGCSYGYLYCSIGGREPILKKVELDEPTKEYIINGVRHFWEEYVMKEVEPPVDGSEACEELIEEMFPAVISDNQIQLASDKINPMIINREIWKRQIDELNEKVKEVDNFLKATVEGTMGAFTDRYMIRYNEEPRKALDQAKVKKEYPDVYANCLKESKPKILRIKEIRQKELPNAV
jgi:putative phage-type endonuclease